MAFLGALAVAEGLISLGFPVAGLALHGGVLFLLLLLSSFTDDRDWRSFLLGLSLAPLIRLLSLSLPLRHFPQEYWYALIGAPLFLATLFVYKLAGFRFQILAGKARRLLWQLLVGLSGIALGYMEYRILRPGPLVGALNLRLAWLPALVLLVFTGLLEELIFRGALQQGALRNFGRPGLVYAAGVFTILHFGYRSALDLLFVFLVAMFFGWVVWRTGSILGVSLSHGVANIVLYLVLPFLFTQSPAAVPAPGPLGAPVRFPAAASWAFAAPSPSLQVPASIPPGPAALPVRLGGALPSPAFPFGEINCKDYCRTSITLNRTIRAKVIKRGRMAIFSACPRDCQCRSNASTVSSFETSRASSTRTAINASELAAGERVRIVTVEVVTVDTMTDDLTGGLSAVLSFDYSSPAGPSQQEPRRKNKIQPVPFLSTVLTPFFRL